MIARLVAPSALAGRCACCGTPLAVGPSQRCRTCGTRWRAGGTPDAARFAGELEEALLAGAGGFPAPGERDWFMDTFTARIAATGARLWLETHGARVEGHEDIAPRGTFMPLDGGPAAGVALVALARPDDPALPGFVARNARRFGEIVLVLDAEPGSPAPFVERAPTILRRRLAGDFAAQRNRAMAAVRSDWAFHLDLDEEIDEALAAMLGHLAARAGAAGLEAVGLPRRNMVDGRMSALFPDIQYRLVRRGQLFENAVHERPLACRDWPRTTIALAGAIEHRLERARLARRSALYESLGQHPERRDDDAALLRPIEGDVPA